MTLDPTRIAMKGRIQPCSKRVRAFKGGVCVADSTRTKLVWEVPHYPAYYFPVDDVQLDRIPDGDRRTRDELAGHVHIRWSRVDAWFEEEEEVFVHAHDPFKRIDMLHSTRHIEVFVDGVKLADSRRPTIVYETGAPVRYYVPKTDVRMELLVATELRTGCAYKGFARYWSVKLGEKVHENIVWSYATPIADCAKVAGLVSFYNEHVDIDVDGVRQTRPAPENDDE